MEGRIVGGSLKNPFKKASSGSLSSAKNGDPDVPTNSNLIASRLASATLILIGTNSYPTPGPVMRLLPHIPDTVVRPQHSTRNHIPSRPTNITSFFFLINLLCLLPT